MSGKHAAERSQQRPLTYGAQHRIANQRIIDRKAPARHRADGPADLRAGEQENAS